MSAQARAPTTTQTPPAPGRRTDFHVRTPARTRTRTRTRTLDPARAAAREGPAMNSPYVARSRIDTPLGALTLAATRRGLAGAWFDGQDHHPFEVDAPDDAAHPLLKQAAREFEAYFRDARHRFTLPLDPQGTEFQRRVWQVLLQIGAGSLSTYGEVARRVGRPDAARATGAAIGRNPIAIVVPCHRVVGKNGSLTGYAAGLPRKAFLLRHEGARDAGDPAPGPARPHQAALPGFG